MKALTATAIFSLALLSIGTIHHHSLRQKLEARRSITGTFRLSDSDIMRAGRLCYGTGGYSDIQSGLKVVVKNERQKIIGVGALGGDIYNGDYPRGVCEFPFAIQNLPKAKFYTVEVGRRGEMTYPYKELDGMNWKVAFSLG